MERIPDEILLKIAGGLSAVEILDAMRAGGRLKRVLSDRSLWKSGSFRFPYFWDRVPSYQQVILELFGHHFKTLELVFNAGGLDSKIFHTLSYTASFIQLKHLIVTLKDSAVKSQGRLIKTSGFQIVLDVLRKASGLETLTVKQWPTSLLDFDASGVGVPPDLSPSLITLDISLLNTELFGPPSSSDVLKFVSNFHSFRHLKIKGGMLGDDLIHALADEGRLERLTVYTDTYNRAPSSVSTEAWKTLTAEIPDLDVQLFLTINSRSCPFDPLAAYFLAPESPVSRVTVQAFELPDVPTILQCVRGYSKTLRDLRYTEHHEKEMHPGRLSHIFAELREFVETLSDKQVIQNIVFEGCVEHFDPELSPECGKEEIPAALYDTIRRRKIYWIRCSDRRTLVSGTRFEWG